MDINNSDFTLCWTVTKPVDQCRLENNDCHFKTKRNFLVQSEACNLKNVSNKRLRSLKENLNGPYT